MTICLQHHKVHFKSHLAQKFKMDTLAELTPSENLNGPIPGQQLGIIQQQWTTSIQSFLKVLVSATTNS